MEASAKTRVTPRDQRGVRWVRSRLIVRLGRTVGGSANDDSLHGSDPRPSSGNHPGRVDAVAADRTRSQVTGPTPIGPAQSPSSAAQSRRADVGVNGGRDRDLTDGDIGVLEAVSGKHADHGGPRRDTDFHQTGD